MFFSYPQWLGQAPDPSMTIPPQPTFRSGSTSHRNHKRQDPAPATAEESNSSANSTSSDSSNSSSHGLDDVLGSSWEPEVESMPEMDSNTFAHGSYAPDHEEYIFSPGSFATEESVPWTDNVASNEDAEAYYTPEHEDAGQPPTYQESETYFYRFTDFYPYVYFSPLDYIRVERHSMPFFRNWCDNIIDDMYRRDFATQASEGGPDHLRDNRSRRATWSSPPYTSKTSKNEPPHSPKGATTSQATKQNPKLGTYSFTFLSQRESFPSTSPNSRSCDTEKATDTAKRTAKSRPIIPLSKPFVYRKPASLRDAVSQYDEHWTILSDVNSSVRWTFHTIPWPQYPPPTSIGEINARKIQRFLLASDINLKVSLRKALLRFHPDKIPKLLANVEEKDKEQVSQGCITVAKCLNEIKGHL